MRDREAAKKRAHNLVAQMSVEEKAEQLKYGASAIGRLGVPSYNWWNEALHGVARAGTATMFPQAIGMAACLLYTSPSPRDGLLSRMPSSA